MILRKLYLNIIYLNNIVKFAKNVVETVANILTKEQQKYII